MKSRLEKLGSNLIMVALPIAIIGATFKLLHWQGANYLLIIGLGSIAIGAMTKYYSEKNIDSYVTGSAIAVCAIAVLFKLLHLNGAEYLIKLAIASAILLAIRTVVTGRGKSGE